MIGVGAVADAAPAPGAAEAVVSRSESVPASSSECMGNGGLEACGGAAGDTEDATGMGLMSGTGKVEGAEASVRRGDITRGRFAARGAECGWDGSHGEPP